jgi:hypothetical protein
VNRLLNRFDEVWVWDPEFIPVPGWHCTPVCMVSSELKSGKTLSVAWDSEGQHQSNPLPFGPRVLHILYSSTADLGFALAAGWGLPCNVLDLWVERRNQTNGLVDNQGYPIETGLIAACHDFGVLDVTSLEEKDASRDRILAGYPFTNEEMRKILDYCHGDVKMLRELANRMVPKIEDLDQAFHRGRCMKAMACIEWNGVPVDTEMLGKLNRYALPVRRKVVQAFEVEWKAGICAFDKNGVPHFTWKGYTAWVRGLGFDEKSWPFDGGRASADDKEVLTPMAVMHAASLPVLEEFRQLRKFLTSAKSEFKFPVGPDGRNRSQFKPFSAISGRSQPPTSENVSNAAKALRSLVKPKPGEVFIHRDWSNAEYGIAAALSHDNKRWDHYLLRDAYLVKAADYGFCTYTATKETHRELRNKFNPVVLAGQYGQTAKGLAKILDISVEQARRYQEREAKLYPAYNAWLRDNEEFRTERGFVETQFGWRLHIPITGSTPRNHAAHLVRQAMNLPMQGNCNEIMRYALCLATERGIDVGATCHDAFDYVAPAGSWEWTDAAMKACMDEASEAVLGDGYILKSDRDVVHPPDRYIHEDGAKKWPRVQKAVEEAEQEATR